MDSDGRARARDEGRGEKRCAERSETPEDPDNDILEVSHEKIGGNEDASKRTPRETKSGLEWNGNDGMVYA